MDFLRTKIAIVGDQKVGKTAIVNQLIKQFFNNSYQTTLGIDYNTYDIKINDTPSTVQLHILDCTGFSAFSDLIYSQIKDVNFILYVYDSTNMESFSSVKLWKENLKVFITNKNCKEYLVGNKVDQEKKILVDDTSSRNLANLYGLKQYSVSAVNYF